MNRKDANTRTRSGYYAPREGEAETREAKEAPSTNNLKLVGLWNTGGLPMRAVAMPLARGRTGNLAEVGIVLSVRLPPPNGPIEETVTVIRNEYNNGGNPTPMIRETLKVPLTPAGGDELRYDLFYLVQLKPGRREVRLHATSAALQKSGTVLVDDMPDFTKPGLNMSAVALGTPADDGDASRMDVLASVSPIKPTSAREFSPNEQARGLPAVVSGRQHARRADGGRRAGARRRRSAGVSLHHDAHRRPLRRSPQRAVPDRSADQRVQTRPISAQHQRHARGWQAGAEGPGFSGSGNRP